MGFDVGQIVNLVGQLGGNHQQAAQMLQNLGGGQIDPNQHSGMLQQLGIDPQQLQSGGYQQHFDAQGQAGFQDYGQGGGYDQSGQGGQGGQGGFGGQQGGFNQQDQNYGGNQGYQQQDQGYQGGGQGYQQSDQGYQGGQQGYQDNQNY